MTAGNYAIVCNLAGHYGKGMRAQFTVTRPTTTVNVTLGDTSGARRTDDPHRLPRHRTRR